ncbi:hypothetical protein pb186bvf_005791 [Paramecium bursaria]
MQQEQLAQNWSKTITYKSSNILIPQNIDELIEIVKNNNHVKVQGTGHSFNLIADTFEDGVIVQLSKFKSIQIDGNHATFGSGVNYTELIDKVHEAGLALLNAPSLPHVNIVGSMVTGSHGSGANKKMLISFASQIKLVDSKGEILTLNQKDENFYYYILGFGGLGIIYEMTIELEPIYNIYKSIYTNLSFQALKENFQVILQQNDYLSLFSQWDERGISSVWVGQKYTNKIPEQQKNFYDAQHIKTDRIHPVDAQDSSACISVGSGVWKDKLFHFLPNKPPSSGGEELHTEYFIVTQYFLEALDELYQNRNIFKHLTQVSEFRPVCKDNIPMSQAKEINVIGIHWTWHKKHDEVLQILPQLEAILNKYRVKPHFGKLFLMNKEKLQDLFGQDFVRLGELIKEKDPQGKFRNEFINNYIMGN